MPIQSLNPFTGLVEKTFSPLTPEQISQHIANAQSAFESWRRCPLPERAKLMRQLAQLLDRQKNNLSQLATTEMGKLFREGTDWEIPICASIATYYADHAAIFLARTSVPVPDGRAFVETEPTGVLLGVMPWNFPYYQVFRFVVPNLMAGNVCLIKHASNVPQGAIALETLFREAGFPSGTYTNLLISASQVESIIDDKRIRGVSLTGSEAAGRKVAERSAQKLKKVVMELGGNDPFIVLDDADLGRAVDAAVEGKIFNSGQCCAAAKRFIILEKIADPFITQFKKRLQSLHPGDPKLPQTGFAPLVSEAAANEVIAVIREAESSGAKVLLGGDRPKLPGAFVNPTILTNIAPGTAAFDKEIFGPVANLFIVQDESHAIDIANATDFGLGSVICSRNENRALKLAERLEAGMVYINTPTLSQPDLLFGGVKNSGFGRELSHLGIQEFVNKKLVRLKD